MNKSIIVKAVIKKISDENKAKQELYETISDFSKDLQGFRERLDIDEMTLKEVEDRFNYWVKQYDLYWKRQEEKENKKRKEIEQMKKKLKVKIPIDKSKLTSPR